MSQPPNLPDGKIQREIDLELPGAVQLFRIESEQRFQVRLREELPGVKNVLFPADVPFSFPAKISESFPLRCVGPVHECLCHRPLYFHDKGLAIHGDYVPCLQPLLSLSKFYFGVAVLPIRMMIAPPWTYECDAAN